MKNIRLKMLVAISSLCAAAKSHVPADCVALGNADEPPANETGGAAKKLAAIETREKAIAAKVAASGGLLTREQAAASYDNQLKFDKLQKEKAK